MEAIHVEEDEDRTGEERRQQGGTGVREHGGEEEGEDEEAREGERREGGEIGQSRQEGNGRESSVGGPEPGAEEHPSEEARAEGPLEEKDSTEVAIPEGTVGFKKGRHR